MKHCLRENNNLLINNHQVEIQTWLQHATLAIHSLTYRFELTRFGDHQKVVPLKPKNERWKENTAIFRHVTSHRFRFANDFRKSFGGIFENIGGCDSINWYVCVEIQGWHFFSFLVGKGLRWPRTFFVV
ncbi:hypothetical protein OIU78_003349 [Salix suchowensis]|nr:hypothetical protein OIU78_003349 [Salix suchowensis]